MALTKTNAVILHHSQVLILKYNHSHFHLQVYALFEEPLNMKKADKMVIDHETINFTMNPFTSETDRGIYIVNIV